MTGFSISINRIYKFQDNSFVLLGLDIGIKSYINPEYFVSIQNDFLQIANQFRDFGRLSFRFSPLSYFFELPYTPVSFMVPIKKR